MIARNPAFGRAADTQEGCGGAPLRFRRLRVGRSPLRCASGPFRCALAVWFRREYPRPRLFRGRRWSGWRSRRARIRAQRAGLAGSAAALSTGPHRIPGSALRRSAKPRRRHRGRASCGQVAGRRTAQPSSRRVTISEVSPLRFGCREYPLQRRAHHSLPVGVIAPPILKRSGHTCSGLRVHRVEPDQPVGQEVIASAVSTMKRCGIARERTDKSSETIGIFPIK